MLGVFQGGNLNILNPTLTLTQILQVLAGFGSKYSLAVRIDKPDVYLLSLALIEVFLASDY